MRATYIGYVLFCIVTSGTTRGRHRQWFGSPYYVALIKRKLSLKRPSFCDFRGQDRNLVKSLRYDSQFYKTAAGGGGQGRSLMVALAVSYQSCIEL